MLYLNQTYELLTGGYYLGNSSWNKKHTEIDNCFKIYQLTEGEVFVCDKDQTFNLQKNNLYFINGNKLSSQYCSYSFSTHWLHFIPKNLTIYQGLLSLPTVIKLPTQKNKLSGFNASIGKITYHHNFFKLGILFKHSPYSNIAANNHFGIVYTISYRPIINIH